MMFLSRHSNCVISNVKPSIQHWHYLHHCIEDWPVYRTHMFRPSACNRVDYLPSRDRISLALLLKFAPYYMYMNLLHQDPFYKWFYWGSFMSDMHCLWAAVNKAFQFIWYWIMSTLTTRISEWANTCDCETIDLCVRACYGVHTCVCLIFVLIDATHECNWIINNIWRLVTSNTLVAAVLQCVLWCSIDKASLSYITNYNRQNNFTYRMTQLYSRSQLYTFVFIFILLEVKWVTCIILNR